MVDAPGGDDASTSAALEFLVGPSLRDAMSPAMELVGHTAWLARPRGLDAARGLGAEPTGWLRERYGLSNL